MQTIPKFSVKPNGDGYTVLWDGQVVGKIDINLTTGKWEYSRYSKYPEVVSADTADELIAIAQNDLVPPFIPAKVVSVAAESTPAYLEGGSWRSAGAGYVTKVVVQTDDELAEVYTVSVPSPFARKLRPGTRVELFQLNNTRLAIRWCPKPVRRSAAA